MLRDVAHCRRARTSEEGFAAGSTDDPLAVPQPQPGASILQQLPQFVRTEAALCRIVIRLTDDNQQLQQKV